MKWPAAICLCISLVAQVAAQAQVRLKGRILDENNTPVAGAEIKLRLDNIECRAYADPTGTFIIDVPQPGPYLASVSVPGYFSLRDRGVFLTAGANDLTLILSRVRERLESLDVSGGSAVIDLDKTSHEQRLSGAELLDIPYRNNNDLRNAMRTMPGVVQDQRGGIHVNGAAEHQVLYTIDGFNIGDPVTGSFQSRLNVEAVQTMSVISGAMPAEYGKGAAGVLAINTRNGDDKLRYGVTNFIPGVEIRKRLTLGSWSPRMDVSGPIKKGRIWFSDSFATQYAQNYVRDLPAGQDRTSDWRFSNMLRAQANLTPSNILYAGFLANYWTSPKSGLSALDPPETTVNRQASQWFYDMKDQIYLGHGAVVELGYASNRTAGRERPQGTDLYRYTTLGRRGNYFVDGARRSSRDQWMANYFLPAFTLGGRHQVKMGVDLDRVSYWQNFNRTGFINYRADNTPARIVIYSGAGLLHKANFESSAYVQDSWRVRPGLLIEMGVRADRDQILSNWSVAPRIGFAWSPWRGDRTKISGGYGLVYNATNLILFTRPSDQYPIATYYPAAGGGPFSSVSSFVIDQRHFGSPRSHNLNLGWEQRFENGFVASAQGMVRRGDHGLSYFDTTGLAPRGIFQLRDAQRDEYTGLDFTIRQNLRRQYQWLASYTRSVARSNAVIDLNADQPLTVLNNSGRLPWDAPNRILTWGLLPTFLPNWSLGYLAEWRSGFPFSIRDERGLIQGGVNSVRFANYFEGDLSLERQFPLRGQRWAWRMGLNNITNHRNFDLVNNEVDSPQFLRFYGGQGRSVNFRVRWLGKL